MERSEEEFPPPARQGGGFLFRPAAVPPGGGEGTPGFQLHLISDRDLPAPRGVDYLQVRRKGAPAADVYAAALGARRRGVGLIVNDRVDVALALGADGVHLARKSLAPEVARRLLRPGMLLGVSVHSLEDARRAAAAGADYVTFGHVFSTGSKPGLPPRGLEALAGVVQGVDIPVLAVGGVSAANLPAVLATGCAGVSVISAIWDAPDPAAAAAELRRGLDAAPCRPRRSLGVLAHAAER